MNCKTVRKYLFAFADGQLGVQANCEVLDHLKMCPQCSKIVDEHQAVRNKLRFSAEQIKVPPLLEGRVRKAIQLGRLVKSAETKRPSILKNRVFRVAALAACITLIVTGAWFVGPWGPANTSPFEKESDPVIRAQNTAMSVRKLHVLCTRKCEGAGHHHEELPNDRENVTEAIRDHYDGQLLAIAPDFSGYGFEFESANFCCPTGCKDEVGAHAMYVDYSNGNRLSLFSVLHWDAINQPGKPLPDRENPFIHSVSQCDDNWILAWHENGMTYICCGLVAPETLLNMVDDIQIARNNVDQDDNKLAGLGRR